MDANIPFNTYKIYSVSTPASEERFQTGPEVRVICLLPEDARGSEPFLQKVLSAARLDEKQYHIIPLQDGERLSASDQGWFETAGFIMLFGISTVSVGIQTVNRRYEVQQISDTKIIQLPGLQEIESDTNEKQKLWHLLKKEFLHE